MKSKSSVKKKVQAIDLFCGIGGLTHGLSRAGIDVIAGLDSDESCRYAYEENNNAKFIRADISKYSGRKLLERYKEDAIKILVGCAPCQTFSKHTQKNKNRHNDNKWNLLYAFADKIKEISPDIVSMENVPGLGKYKVFYDFVQHLKNLNYEVYYRIVRCEQYGVPQTRRRLVLLASKLGPISLVKKTYKSRDQYETVRKTIGKLPKLDAGSFCKKDKFHRAASLSDLNKARIYQSIPGGTWRNWDPNLLPACYKRISGATYPSVYGRLKWDDPASTITTQFFAYGTGRFGHPEQDRALSLREGSMLQTFPKTYKFVKPGEPIFMKILGRHIGNAVPVRLGEIIGRSIMKHLDDYL